MGDSFAIQISSDLIDRLVDDENRAKKKVKKPKQKAPQVTQQPVNKAKSAPSSSQVVAPTGGWPPLHPPVYLPVPTPPPAANAELEAIKSVLHESEKVVERLKKQEDNMVQELTQRAKEIRDKEFKLPYQKPVPCLDERNACRQCYEEHLKDPLKCGDLVNKFADCAREARKQATSANQGL